MELSFAVDGMLGRLAKYLRALGFNVLYNPALGAGLLKQCESEGRVLVTLRRSIPESFSCRVIRPSGGSLEDQLKSVFDSLRLRPVREKTLTTCLACNVPTKEAPLPSVTGRVPKGVREMASSFRICPVCQKLYWWGSHAERIKKILERSGVFDLPYREVRGGGG